MSKSTRSKNISKLIILALVLFVPGFLYIMVNKMGSNEYVKLPVFGEKKLTGKMKRVMGREIPDTLFHTLEPLKITDVNNRPIAFLNADTLVSVVHLFYASDSGLSKQLLQDMSTISNRFKDNNKVHLYSISVDSTDTLEKIKAFVKEYEKGKSPNWYFIQKPNIDILKYAREQMLIEAMPATDGSNKFIISNHIVLLDSERRIRGLYDISLRSEIGRLEDEIKVQLVEEIRNHPLKVERK